MDVRAGPLRSTHATAIAPLAAVAVAFDILLQRLLAPVVAHIPNAPLPAPVVDLLDRAAALTPGMAVATVAVAALALAVARDGGGAQILLLPALAVLTLAAARPTPAMLLAGHLVVVAGLSALVAARLARSADLMGAVTLVLAGAVLVARLPMIAELTGSQLLPAAAATLVSELLLVWAIVLAGIAMAPREAQRRAALAAVAGGVAAVLLLAGSPYAGVLAMWGMGLTLALPLPLYALAAAAFASLLVQWRREPGSRLAICALVLLAGSALQPGLVHYQMATLVAVGWLAEAMPAGISITNVPRRPAELPPGGAVSRA